jgi:DNA-directed RNA polymerase specialized sigma subunit
VLIMARRTSADRRALDQALADLDRAVADALDAVQQHDGQVAQSVAAMKVARALQEHGKQVAMLRGELAERIADDDRLSMSELAAALGISKSRAHQLVLAARRAQREA